MSEKYQSKEFNKNFFQWWNKDGEFALLHKINPVRNKYILKIISEYFKSENFAQFKLLDIGCGGGLVSSFFDKLEFNVTAIDPNPETIKAAIQYKIHNKLKANYINSNLVNFSKNTSEKFNIILCLEILEHIDDLENFLSLAIQLIDKNGLLIISTINKNIQSYIKMILLCEYILKIIPKNTHQYDKFLKPSYLNKILTKLEMKFLKLDGLDLNLLNGEFYISEKIKSNYFITYYK
ncbi:MAG: bifunctional 2-polyprenyl-6-hydroxyphenol methylase/3-demethylubiquinol 3-O-methyltransferase UbiG [Rickettsia sp.]|nr:bifunctional 2-polyprenyl-6-hydroxyphenol methylase/3-demethylubiquinol 3-O-methyltransferase UbiG [Rickettsia sp.]